MEPCIFLSPHLDDVVLSCGGMIREMQRKGREVQVWTIFAGDPPGEELTPFARSLHERWGIKEKNMNIRREEDANACRILGVEYFHFEFPDCIYRTFPHDAQPVIRGEEDLFNPGERDEVLLFQEIIKRLAEKLPEKYCLVVPLTLGGHIDHILTRRAASVLQPFFWSYADYPYAEAAREAEKKLVSKSSRTEEFEFGEKELEVWLEAVAAYKSQISTFWESIAEMRRKISAYWQSGGGKRLWFFD